MNVQRGGGGRTPPPLANTRGAVGWGAETFGKPFELSIEESRVGLVDLAVLLGAPVSISPFVTNGVWPCVYALDVAPKDGYDFVFVVARCVTRASPVTACLAVVHVVGRVKTDVLTRVFLVPSKGMFTSVRGRRNI